MNIKIKKTDFLLVNLAITFYILTTILWIMVGLQSLSIIDFGLTSNFYKITMFSLIFTYIILGIFIAVHKPKK